MGRPVWPATGDQWGVRTEWAENLASQCEGPFGYTQGRLVVPPSSPL
jgi:hypothetical protein